MISRFHWFGLLLLGGLLAGAVYFLWLQPARDFHEFVPGKKPHAQPVATVADSAPDQLDQSGADDSLDSVNSVRDRFAGSVILESSETQAGKDRMLRQRLLRSAGSDKLVRVEEELSRNKSGEWVLSSQSAMLAGQVLVRLKNDADRHLLEDLAQREGYLIEEISKYSSFVKVILPEIRLDAVPEHLKKIEETAGQGLLAEPDYLYFPSVIPNDSLVATQYAIERIGADKAWSFTTGSSAVAVATIDSGIDMDHPDLVGNIDTALARDFDDFDDYPDDEDGHGSHVAGILGAVGNNGIGVAGVNWNLRIIPVRVGTGTYPTSNIVSALDYVLGLKRDSGVPVVATNNSYGSTSPSNSLRDAIERQQQEGILFVAAAGNDSFNNDLFPEYPAGYDIDNVISVAATNGADNLASFSNYGATSVDLGAPGYAIRSTIRGGAYEYYNGTSMSTPYVTGSLALIKSVAPSITAQELKDIVFATVDPLPTLNGFTVTGGRLNVYNAIAELLEIPVFRLVEPVDPAEQLVNAGSGLYLKGLAEFNGIPDFDDELQWQAFPENANVVIQPDDEYGAVVFFPGPGEYRIRATHTVGSLDQVEEIFVKVGDAELVTDGLAAYWKFDEGTGAAAADSSGSGRTASLNGPVWATGRLGSSLSFDGSNDGASFSAPSLPKLTVSAWVRSSSAGNSIFPRIVNTDEFVFFFGREDNGPEPNNRTLKFVGEKSGSYGVWNTMINRIGDDSWIHVAATYDATSSVGVPDLYINGVKHSVSAQMRPSGSRVIAPNATGYIGDNGDSSQDRNWHGLIDDVRIYNRILAPSEVAALATQPDMNQVPQVDAGEDQSVSVGISLALAATAEDPDGLDSLLDYTWISASGPGVPAFSNASVLAPEVTFPATGEYVLRFMADDGSAAGVDELTVTVGTDLPVVTLSVDRSNALRNPGESVLIAFTSDRILEQDLTLNLSSSGSAVSSVDYDPLPDTVQLGAGTQSATVPLIPLSTPASAVSVILTLETGSDYFIGDVSQVQVSLLPHTWDNWLTRYYEGESIPLGNNAYTADPDNDGLPNLLEYALGLSPRSSTIDSTDGQLPEAFILEAEGDEYLAIRFRRPVNLSDVAYMAEVSSANAFNDWVGGSPHTELFQVSGMESGSEMVVYRAVEPLSSMGDQAFIRLRVDAIESN